MKVTSDPMERKYCDMLLKLSGEERLKTGCSMSASERAMVRASALADERTASAAALKALFLRFYGRDFDSAVRKRILRALATARPKVPLYEYSP